MKIIRLNVLIVLLGLSLGFWMTGILPARASLQVDTHVIAFFVVGLFLGPKWLEFFQETEESSALYFGGVMLALAVILAATNPKSIDGGTVFGDALLFPLVTLFYCYYVVIILFVPVAIGGGVTMLIESALSRLFPP